MDVWRWALPAAAATLAVGATARTWSQVARASRTDRPGAGAAIVVFGARATPVGPSPELAARLRHALALYEAGCAPYIVVSGGVLPHVSEPEVMAAALRSWGVPEGAIIRDTTGRTTRGTLSAIRRRGAGDTVIAVSSPYHMHRITREARRLKLRLACSPAPSSPVMRQRGARRRQVAREVVATWWYAVSALVR